MKLPPSPVPISTNGSLPEDGGVVSLCQFCDERILNQDAKCIAHYRALVGKSRGFHQCPWGFTSYKSTCGETHYVLTGVVASPRFQTANETQRAKHYSDTRVSRELLLRYERYVSITREWEEQLEAEARSRLPQALHELRKLNAIVKQNAELLPGADEIQEVRNIASAAELMSNNFEVVEALADIASLRRMKIDEHIAIFDLAYKAKKIYQIRAREKPIHLHVGGETAVAILGNRKIFPIVLTVLVENAIRYGRKDSVIEIEVAKTSGKAILRISNKTDEPFDAVRCFDKGQRFATRSGDGSGLGLFLAKEVVELHAGKISCSFQNGDVTFTVELPAKA